MPLKIALPKGRLLKSTAALLQKADWGLDEYHSRISFYHPKSRRFPGLVIKVFHEKDIPIQVAIGNYDLGICGEDWVQELVAKYPSSAVVKVRDLAYGNGALFLAASAFHEVSLEKMNNNGLVRIASEYPNLAESFALHRRLGRFRVFPVWGAAEGYPPENAELALVAVKTAADLAGFSLTPLAPVLNFHAALIANRESWAKKDLGEIVNSISDASARAELRTSIETAPAGAPGRQYTPAFIAEDTVRLALPDGHQQQPTLELLQRCGIQIEDYPSDTGNRRPRISLPGVAVKVIRPQDMPPQVASGNFDLAVTGKDWLREHRNQFPASPVQELADLRFGRVKIVAVVSQELAVQDAATLRQFNEKRESPLRIASEYTHLADRYARENHLGYYRIVPTWGATEAFLPEDADLLIENTETGRTIARHNLRIIDTLFESTACLIGSTVPVPDPVKQERIKSIIMMLRQKAEEP